MPRLIPGDPRLSAPAMIVRNAARGCESYSAITGGQKIVTVMNTLLKPFGFVNPQAPANWELRLYERNKAGWVQHGNWAL